MVLLNPNPNPNPAPGFCFFDPVNMGLPELNPLPPPPNTSMSTSSAAPAHLEDPAKKIRKPYTITKSRESWTEQEHDKFLEALQLFDRDWKKIEAFVGSKTVIQIRSHAQKYFLKAQKNGTAEHVPPPRPKRKAAHPYPQKAPKNVAVVPQVVGPFQSSSALLESGYTYRPHASSVLGNPIAKPAWPSWSYDSAPPVTVSQVTKDDAIFSGPIFAPNSCYSSGSNESNPRTWSFGETIARGDHGKQSRVVPDFSQVYAFLGSVFDSSSSGHLQKLKEIDPINVETVVVLMRNLSANLRSPEFEVHRRLLSKLQEEKTDAAGMMMLNSTTPHIELLCRSQDFEILLRREEVEQLFSGHKRVSEASRRVVHEEEERILLIQSFEEKVGRD
ncbi:hypothetical protein V6N11_015768 [Hibiscus sabdariffa]|uniref:Uncharacterized protein n=1 Tax=Hibiscus sabdariffa TaxID=183260 RepID=A0ABR2TTD4_9ROSI